MLRTLLLTLSLLLPLPALADTNVHAFDQGHPPAMLRAIDQARASLPALMAKTMDAKGRMSASVSLKVAIPIPQGFENIWVYAVRKRGNGYRGKLGNTPIHIKGKRMDDTVKFTQAQIVDWSLKASDGRAFGHYTTRVIVKRLPADQAASVRATLTRAPLPKGF